MTLWLCRAASIARFMRKKTLTCAILWGLRKMSRERNSLQKRWSREEKWPDKGESEKEKDKRAIKERLMML